MLGVGEQLRKLTITVEQLLDRSVKNVREWDKVLQRFGHSHCGSIYFLPTRKGCCIPVFIHIGRCQTTEV